MAKVTSLTGITTSGTPHLGNYVGAIKPSIEASKREDIRSCYFLADYHALIKNQDPKNLKVSSSYYLTFRMLECGSILTFPP